MTARAALVAVSLALAAGGASVAIADGGARPRRIAITVTRGGRIERKLPLDTPVAVSVRFPRAGKIRYACAMDMHRGVVTVQ